MDLPSPSVTCLLVLADGKLKKLSELYDSESLAGTPSSTVQFVRCCAGERVLPTSPPSNRLVVLHKAGYDFATREFDPVAAARWELLRNLPARSLLEPLDCAVLFSDRCKICRRLAQLAPAVRQPGCAWGARGAERRVDEPRGERRRRGRG